MDIDKSLVGKIIGRGGATIQGLTDRTGAKLQMDQNVPEGHPRKLTISGAPAACQQAQALVQQIIDQEKMHGSSTATQAAVPAGGVAETLEVEKQHVGRIIGKQ